MNHFLPEARWTGGSWSVIRALLGAWLVVHFARIALHAEELVSPSGALVGSAGPCFRSVPSPFWLSETPAVVSAMGALGVAAGLLVAVGFRDRVAALVCAWLIAAFLARDPLVPEYGTYHVGLLQVGVLLLAHAAMPRAPFGSLEARGRIDPGGGWRVRRGAWIALWLAVLVFAARAGLSRLEVPSWRDGSVLANLRDVHHDGASGLRAPFDAFPDGVLAGLAGFVLAAELLALPLSVWRPLRPWAWLALFLAHMVLLLAIRSPAPAWALVLVHLAAFDPAWLRGKRGGLERFYYDGSCGLCHRAVRFVLAEDVDGSRFRVAPLHGEAFEARVPPDQRANLPDSVIVQGEDGRIRVRSDAALHVLERLGGAWRAIGTAGRAIPRPLRDRVYDGVARVRKHLFDAPREACPLLPRELRDRFEA